MEENQKPTQEQILLEILEHTRATKRYIKWQLIITVALVVVPLLASLAIVPMVMSSLSSVYGQDGIIQNIQGLNTK